MAERYYITDTSGVDVYLQWHQVIKAGDIIHSVTGIVVKHKLENMLDTTGYYRVFVEKKYSKQVMRDMQIAIMCAKMC